MSKEREKVEAMICDFCGRSEFQAEAIVANNGSAICDRCVDAASSICAARRLGMDEDVFSSVVTVFVGALDGNG